MINGLSKNQIYYIAKCTCCENQIWYGSLKEHAPEKCPRGCGDAVTCRHCGKCLIHCEGSKEQESKDALEIFSSWWHKDLNHLPNEYQLAAFLTDKFGGPAWKLDGLRITVGDLRKIQKILRKEKK